LKLTLKNFIRPNSKRGSVSLIGAAMTAILSLFLLFLVLKMQVEYREAQYRKKSYLCFRYLTTQTESYIQKMTKFNWALRTAYAAQFSVVASEEAVVIFKNLVIIRNSFHISYMKNLMQNKYCSFPESVEFVKNQPYQVKSIFLLDTSLDETTKIRAHQWKSSITLIPPKIRISRLFVLTANFSIESAFTPNFSYTSKEIGKKDLLN